MFLFRNTPLGGCSHLQCFDHPLALPMASAETCQPCNITPLRYHVLARSRPCNIMQGTTRKPGTLRMVKTAWGAHTMGYALHKIRTTWGLHNMKSLPQSPTCDLDFTQRVIIFIRWRTFHGCQHIQAANHTPKHAAAIGNRETQSVSHM